MSTLTKDSIKALTLAVHHLSSALTWARIVQQELTSQKLSDRYPNTGKMITLLEQLQVAVFSTAINNNPTAGGLYDEACALQNTFFRMSNDIVKGGSLKDSVKEWELLELNLEFKMTHRSRVVASLLGWDY